MWYAVLLCVQGPLKGTSSIWSWENESEYGVWKFRHAQVKVEITVGIHPIQFMYRVECLHMSPLHHTIFKNTLSTNAKDFRPTFWL